MNNPATLVDPSGQNPLLAAMGLGGLIGGLAAAITYALSNPCQSLADILSSPGFWSSMVTGVIAGLLSGLLMGGLGGLGIIGNSFFSSVGLGAFIGGITGAFAEGVFQYITHGQIIDLGAIFNAGIFGAISGAVFSAIGYGVGKVIRNHFTSNWNAVKKQPFAYDSFSPAGSGGTDAAGNIKISPQSSATQQLQALNHERVHSLLTPRGFGQTYRQTLAAVVYKNSSPFRFLEETIAETVAQATTGGSVSQGLTFSYRQRLSYNIDMANVIGEALTLVFGAGGLMYGINEVLQ